MFRKIIETHDNLAAPLLRAALGAAMLPHALQKLFGWYGGQGFSASLQFFTESLGIPWLLAFLAILAEILGTVGVLLGFLTRLAGLALAAVMAGAVYYVHFEHGFFMNWYGNQAGEGFEYHLLAIGMGLALAVLGGGRWSVDRSLTVR